MLFLSALPLPECFTTDQSTVEASLFVNLFISVTVTSSEVKKRLHEFVISKKQKDLAIASLSGAQAFKHWLVKRLLFVEIYLI